METNPLSRHFERQATYNLAANRIVLATLEERRVEGRALASFQHAVASELRWLRRLTGGDDAVPIWGGESFEASRALIAEASEGLLAYVQWQSAEGFDGSITYSTSWGAPQSTRIDDVLAHVFNHSAQYRGEALGELGHDGSTVPDIDLIAWQRKQGAYAEG